MHSGAEQKYVGVVAYKGGFLVTTGESMEIVTSLNRAMKLMKDYLLANLDASDEAAVE
jgi:hypothetical protein